MAKSSKSPKSASNSSKASKTSKKPPDKPAAGAPPTPVPRTGLARCWDATGAEITCSGSGQDGEVRAGVSWPSPRFVDNRDGSVTDRVTELTWLRDADRFGEVPWTRALEHARNLESGSGGLEDGSRRGDWRLPNIKELLSLIDYSAAAPALPRDHPFQRVRNAIYWTSTTLASAPALAWMVTLGIAPAVFDLKVNASRMWPVRGEGKIPRTGQAECWDEAGRPIDGEGTGQDGELRAGVEPADPRFEDNGDGTVTDHMTGLVWLKNANAYGWRRWDRALEECNALCDGEHDLADGSAPGDWRLPNVREVESLIDYGRFGPSLPEDHPFDGVAPTSYWTSTTVESAPTQAMFTILGVGPTIFENKEHPLLVWPVRDRRPAD